MTEHALITRPVQQNEWAVMKEQGTMLIKTGFLPDAIKTPEQAVAIMLKGRELNIPSMYALSNIAVIKGKPTAGAELMLALIYRDQGDNAIKITESTDKVCTIEYRRRTWDKPETYSFTWQDATTANLTGNNTWKSYPKAMLRARCISAVARMAFPDSIGGMYTPEELGAEVTVTSEDEYVVHVPEITIEPSDILNRASHDQKLEVMNLAKSKGYSNDETKEIVTQTLGSFKASDQWTTDDVSKLTDAINAKA